MAPIKTLTQIEKPNLSYEEKKPRLRTIKHDKKQRKYTLQIRKEKKKKDDEKENPIINVNFQQDLFSKAFVESFLWWITEIHYCQRNNFSLGESHHQAIVAMRNKAPKQFHKLEEKLELDLQKAATLGDLYELFLTEYLSRTNLRREPHKERKGNASPARTQINRIQWLRKNLPTRIDPIALTPKKLVAIFEKLETTKSEATGNFYSYGTLKTYFSLILTIYRRAMLEKNRWIDINPLQNTTILDMPGHQKGEERTARKKSEQKRRLTQQEREWLIDACSDKPMLKFLVAYLLHKPTRGSEAKDMLWKDFRFDEEEGCWFVYAKVDRKKVAVTYQEIPLPFAMSPYVNEWKRLSMIRGHGAENQRVLWGISDEHLAYNRAIRDQINHRIKIWNKKNPGKYLDIKEEIINTIRSAAFYYLLDMGVDIKAVADIGGTSVQQIEKKYCANDKDNAKIAGKRLIAAQKRKQKNDEDMSYLN